MFALLLPFPKHIFSSLWQFWRKRMWLLALCFSVKASLLSLRWLKTLVQVQADAGLPLCHNCFILCSCLDSKETSVLCIYKRRQHANLPLILTVVKTVYFHDSRTGEIAFLELKMLLLEGCFCSHATKYLTYSLSLLGEFFPAVSDIL